MTNHIQNITYKKGLYMYIIQYTSNGQKRSVALIDEGDPRKRWESTILASSTLYQTYNTTHNSYAKIVFEKPTSLQTRRQVSLNRLSG